MLELDMTSFHGKAIGHSFLFMYNSEWEFNLKGTHCMCSYALTIMKNLRVMLKKEEHSSSKYSYIFQVFFHLNSQFTIFEAVGLFQPN